MIAMAKKREDREKGKKTRADAKRDLDAEFKSPIRSFSDLSPANIREALSGSRYLQILLSLTVIGAILRFYNLGFNSLWLDEATTRNIALRSLPDIWQTTTGGEFNPPLFYWVEHFMLTLGNSEVILRFVPALLGILTIPLVYCIGREFMDRNTGILAAAAVAFSPFLIYYSQEARAYAMMLFFVALSMVFYLKALKSNDLVNWGMFGLFSALAFWSHFYALVITGALFLYALYDLFPRIRNNPVAAKPLVCSGAIFAIVGLPLILVTVQLFAKRSASAPTFGIQGPGLIIATFSQISGSDLAMYFLGILFLAGIVQAFLIDRNKGIFLVTLMVMTFVISDVLSYKIPMQPRYLIFLAIVYFIAIALCYRPLYALIRSPGVVYGFMALLIVINALMLVPYYSTYSKEDWRGFAGGLAQLTRPGDFVVVVPGYVSQPLDYYYSNATDRTIEVGADNGTQLAEINAGRNNNTVFYVVTGDISAANPGGDAIAWLENNTKSRGSTTGIYLLTSG